MLQGEHSAILSTSIKLPFVIKVFVLSIFEWPLNKGFTVLVTALISLTWFFSSLYHFVNVEREMLKNTMD